MYDAEPRRLQIDHQFELGAFGRQVRRLRTLEYLSTKSAGGCTGPKDLLRSLEGKPPPPTVSRQRRMAAELLTAISAIWPRYSCSTLSPCTTNACARSFVIVANACSSASTPRTSTGIVVSPSVRAVSVIAICRLRLTATSGFHMMPDATGPAAFPSATQTACPKSRRPHRRRVR